MRKQVEEVTCDLCGKAIAKEFHGWAEVTLDHLPGEPLRRDFCFECIRSVRKMYQANSKWSSE